MQWEGAARLGGEGLLHAGSPRRTQGTRLAVIMTLKAWGHSSRTPDLQDSSWGSGPGVEREARPLVQPGPFGPLSGVPHDEEEVPAPGQMPHGAPTLGL